MGELRMRCSVDNLGLARVPIYFYGYLGEVGEGFLEALSVTRALAGRIVIWSGCGRAEEQSGISYSSYWTIHRYRLLCIEVRPEVG